MAVPRVVHVCNSRTLKGSRLQMELAFVPATTLFAPRTRPNPAVLRAVRSAVEPTVFVFHENSLLPDCLLAASYVKAARLPHRIVFDLQDLIGQTYTWEEPDARRLITQGAFRWIHRRLKRLDVQVITVSQGLADIAEQDMGIRPRVVYSIPPSITPDPMTQRYSDRLLYFGMINDERLSVSLIEQLHSAGYAVDVYGRYSPFVQDWFPSVLEPVLELCGGRLMGPYSSSDLGFVQRYPATLMVFSSHSDNYRFNMANKVFQALESHTPLIVAEHLDEIRTTFADSGAVFTLPQFIAGDLPSPRWDSVDATINRLREDSRKAYLDALGAH